MDIFYISICIYWTELVSMDEYNLVVIGGGGVGKTALSIQMIQDYFIDDYEPINQDSYSKQLVIDGVKCTMTIIDTADREELIRAGHGFLLVYSITSRGSFDNIRLLHEQILRIKNDSRIPVILCGNKCDLENEREILSDEANQLARDLKCYLIETSAKVRTNVNEAFITLVRLVRLVRLVMTRPKTRNIPQKHHRCQLL